MTRKTLQEELLRIWDGLKATVILVTHDSLEAIFLADRVIVFASNPGRIFADVNVPLLARATTTSSVLILRRTSFTFG